MARYDASSAEVLVFSFKDGLLSAVAHDLKLKATRFTLEVEGSRATLSLEADSLRVVTPMKDGKENAGLLPTALYGEIEKNTANDVLEVKRYPRIEFVSESVTDTEVVGKLTLHGQTRTVKGTRTGQTVEFRLLQRDFGIKPFSAMLGSLKVKDEVRVVVKLSASPRPGE
jgi:polyisoprenoid-binding protein YceI